MKERSAYFDNAKAVLIVLVVLGHFTSLNKQLPIYGAINNIIYAFHMPLFIFISGYFSRDIVSWRRKEVSQLLYAYLVFQLLNWVFTRYTGLGVGKSLLIYPTHQNWYLLGMFIWRLLAPYFRFVNKIGALSLGIIIAFSIGFIQEFNAFLGLYRIVYFFPFFLLGFLMSGNTLITHQLSRYKYLFISLSVILLGLVFAFSYKDSGTNNLLSFAYTPFTNYADDIIGFYWRIFGFFSSVFIALGVLFLIPERQTFYSTIGRSTLNIFLAHMFLVFSIQPFVKNLPIIYSLPIVLISSVLICFIFSRPFMDKMLRPLTDFDQLRAMIRKVPFIGKVM
ncbi:MAG: acyltransferase family protein [Bacteroidia bacterium]